MTNYDRIKQMSIDEMAYMLMCPAEYDLDFNIKEKCQGEMNRNCYKCTLKWLESEVEE